MQSKTRSNPTSASNENTLSLTALIVVLVLTNVWFVSQVMPYVG
jgi:hypothetical protein